MKRIVSLILAILAVLSPFALAISTILTMPTVYHNSFTASLVDKYERLEETREEKIVIVGGSSVAFGYESELIEKHLGMPVVNFGVYAALGTKVMMDLSLSQIHKGDIVILAPELAQQTLSLYYNGEQMLEACEERPSLIFSLPPDDLLKTLGALYNFGTKKYERLKRGTIPDPTGIYHRESFNSYGDISYPREMNILPAGFDPNQPIDLKTSIVTDEFVDYVNKYAQKVRQKGAEIYFAYCPMNEASLQNTEEEELAFAEYLIEKIDITPLGDIRTFSSDAGYFYDTNFHLNDIGKRKHTIEVLMALALELGIPLSSLEKIPPPPPIEVFDSTYDGADDENMKYFTYAIDDFGITLTGLTDLGKTQTTLIAPVGFAGRKVTIFGEGMLDGGIVTTFIVPENSPVFRFEDNVFRGASTLSHLVLFPADADAIMPPTSFYGVASGFLTHVLPGSDYDTSYYWRERGLTFVFDAEGFR